MAKNYSMSKSRVENIFKWITDFSSKKTLEEELNEDKKTVSVKNKKENKSEFSFSEEFKDDMKNIHRYMKDMSILADDIDKDFYKLIKILDGNTSTIKDIDIQSVYGLLCDFVREYENRYGEIKEKTNSLKKGLAIIDKDYKNKLKEQSNV